MYQPHRRPLHHPLLVPLPAAPCPCITPSLRWRHRAVLPAGRRGRPLSATTCVDNTRHHAPFGRVYHAALVRGRHRPRRRPPPPPTHRWGAGGSRGVPRAQTRVACRCGVRSRRTCPARGARGPPIGLMYVIGGGAGAGEASPSAPPPSSSDSPLGGGGVAGCPESADSRRIPLRRAVAEDLPGAGREGPSHRPYVYHWPWRSWCGGGIALGVAPFLL